MMNVETGEYGILRGDIYTAEKLMRAFEQDYWYGSIKIDLEDVSPVIRSFERFNYTVLYYFMEKGMVDDLLQQRMEELVRYMNI